MALRCPGYGDVTWIVPMVVINSQRNRTFDGCTVMYGNQSVSKISHVMLFSTKSTYRQMLSMLNLCVHAETSISNDPIWSASWNSRSSRDGTMAIHTRLAGWVSYTAKIVQNFVQHRIDHGRLFFLSFSFLVFSFFLSFLFFFFFLLFIIIIIYIYIYIYEAKQLQ